MNRNNKAIILLSGGLDSVVSISEAIKYKYDIELALTFNYGQKALKRELISSKKVSEYYKIEHKVIKLDWLENILDFTSDWIPNRNSLFINIASCYAEKFNYDNIIIGINKEEGVDFKDNTKEFADKINEALKTSTQNEVRAYTPLINKTKEEIIITGIENNIPFEYIYSCYSGNERHCGECKSCKLLKNALIKNNRYDLIDKLF